MCSYSALLLSYAPFFCRVKIAFCPLFITVSRYYDMYTQGGVHIRPLRTPKGVPFLPVSAPFLTLTSLVRLVAKRNSPVRNPIFSLIVHAYSCYQSENIYSICLLKRVINPSVLNHSIRYDNNAIRITCQEVFVDFQIYIKYDMLISIEKSNERSGYTKLWSIMKRKSVS